MSIKSIASRLFLFAALSLVTPLCAEAADIRVTEVKHFEGGVFGSIYPSKLELLGVPPDTVQKYHLFRGGLLVKTLEGSDGTKFVEKMGVWRMHGMMLQIFFSGCDWREPSESWTLVRVTRDKGREDLLLSPPDRAGRAINDLLVVSFGRIDSADRLSKDFLRSFLSRE